jgi:hypothetical protein
VGIITVGALFGKFQDMLFVRLDVFVMAGNVILQITNLVI